MTQPVAVGIDVGGTKLVAFSVTADGAVAERQRLTSPRGDPHALVNVITRAADALGPGLPVGVGVAGIVSRDGVLNYGPNLELGRVPLRSLVGDALGVPVTVVNDVTAALYGELTAGIARNGLDVVMLTLGTGVGGAMTSEGELVLGANGIAGELGHMPVVDGGRRCPCGNRGCLEAYASGSAIGARAEELLADSDEPSSLRDAGYVDGKSVTLAALDGDDLAGRILRETGYWLGVGVLGLTNIFDPDLVVVGGGASTLAGPLLLPEATEVMSRRILGRGHRPPPPLALAELGDDAGAIGAAMYVVDTVDGADEASA